MAASGVMAVGLWPVGLWQPVGYGSHEQLAIVLVLLGWSSSGVMASGVMAVGLWPVGLWQPVGYGSHEQLAIVLVLLGWSSMWFVRGRRSCLVSVQFLGLR